jgi:hypothetical protein
MRKLCRFFSKACLWSEKLRALNRRPDQTGRTDLVAAGWKVTIIERNLFGCGCAGVPKTLPVLEN